MQSSTTASTGSASRFSANNRNLRAIDTDTLNPTLLLQYAPLKATHLKLSQGHLTVTM